MMAQTGNTGVVMDVEITPKCEDDGSTQTDFISVYVFRVGDNTPQLFGHFNQAGGSYSISDPDDVTLGWCESNNSSGIDTFYDFEMIPKCDTANSNTSYYTLILNKTTTSNGNVTQSKVGDYNINGGSYSPGASIAGYCDVGSELIDTLYDYEIVMKCDTDNDVGYFTLIEKKTIVATGSLIISKIGDYNGNGGSYSPGTNKVGLCYDGATRVERNVLRVVSTSTGSISVTNNTLTDLVITNVGFENGTITPNGQAATNLLPGEKWYCHAVLDPTNNIWQICPDLSWNATGTTFHINYRTVPE